MHVNVEDITNIFPRPLDEDEIQRAENLLIAATELIEEAFLRRGRDFHLEVMRSRLLALTYKRVVREMISEAIHVGDNVGRASASSTTGPQSDSITWSQGVPIHWGGVHLDDRWLKDLGLVKAGGTKGRFGRVEPYAGSDVSRARPTGAWFAERRRGY